MQLLGLVSVVKLQNERISFPADNAWVRRKILKQPAVQLFPTNGGATNSPALVTRCMMPVVFRAVRFAASLALRMPNGLRLVLEAELDFRLFHPAVAAFHLKHPCFADYTAIFRKKQVGT